MLQQPGRKIPLFSSLIVLLGMTAAAPVHASLGQPESSVESDRQALSASDHTRTQRQSYVIREFGTRYLTVREYVAQSNGVVFAIVWHGRHHPPLTSLLGSYFGEYRKAVQPLLTQPRGKLRPRTARANLTTDNLILERSGHFGALAGRVYMPAQLPKEVKIDEIQ